MIRKAWGLEVLPENIPDSLKAHRRWVLWRAFEKPNDKYDKRPVKPHNPEVNENWSDPATWLTFDEAYAHYAIDPDLSGVGFVMTGIADDPLGDSLVAIDIDNCVTQTWTSDKECYTSLDKRGTHFTDTLETYWELSPSGEGLRGFVFSEIESDSNSQGVEVYDGSAARFLTITGNQWFDTANEVALYGAASLAKTSKDYATSGSSKDAGEPMPDLVDNILDSLDVDFSSLPEHIQEYVFNGLVDPRYPSESECVAAVITHLFRLGLSEAEVLSFAWDNGDLYNYASRKRSNPERALKFLWEEVQRCDPHIVADITDFDLDDEPYTPPVDRETPEASTPEPEETVDQPKRPPRKTRIVEYEELLQRDPVQWIVDGVLPKTGLVTLFSAPGMGKTFAVVDLMTALLTKGHWLGKHRIAKPVGSVYFRLEGDLTARLLAAVKHHELDPGSLKQKLVTLEGEVNLRSRDSLKDICLTLRDYRESGGDFGVIFVDTLNRAMSGGNENDVTDMGLMVAAASKMSRLFDCLVVFVHHTGKSASAGLRGHSSLLGSCDAVLEIKGDRQGEYREIFADKVKEGKDRYPLGFYKLKEVTLTPWDYPDNVQSNLPDDTPMSSCVLEIAEDMSSLKEEKELEGVPAEMLGMFYELSEEGPVTKTALRKACKEFWVAEGVAENTVKARLRNGLNKLLGEGYLQADEGGILTILKSEITEGIKLSTTPVDTGFGTVH